MQFYRSPHSNSYLFHCKIAESIGRSYQISGLCRAAVCDLLIRQAVQHDQSHRQVAKAYRPKGDSILYALVGVLQDPTILSDALHYRIYSL